MLVTTLAEEEDAASLSTSCTATAVGTNEKGNVVSVPNGWGPLVDAAASQAELPASLVAAQLAQESGWNPDTTSPVGAQGLAQFMPATWATYGNGGDPFDPEDAIAAMGRYMAALKKEIQPIAGDNPDELVRLTLAAYNAGPGAVQEHRGVPPYPETQQYVEKILDGTQSTFSADCKAPTGPGPGTETSAMVSGPPHCPGAYSPPATVGALWLESLAGPTSTRAWTSPPPGLATAAAESS
ncbi:lytic transglycosylase domain-containing protein [Kocuria atrinae]|uniref:lytic transglycosylase domain-containing protein n=1 Tax=Kocuria atrinae TaxID=592377 RepID=UPI0002F69169|nr:lytic transglycosylase domain-containing protein [Kocuria atrinae]